MKIACVYPALPDWPKFKWVHETLAGLGHEVIWVPMWKELEKADEISDLVLFQHRYPIRWPNLKDIAAKKTATWAQWWFDLIALESRTAPAQQEAFLRYHDIMSAMDVVFVKEKGFVESYREAGVNAVYLDQGYMDAGRVTHDACDTDVLIWGQGCPRYRTRQKDALALVSAGLTVRWASREPISMKGVQHVPWTHPSQLAALASSSRMVLSCGRRNDIEGYVSDSFWMATGMGCCVLRRATPGLPDGPYLTYESREELAELAKAVTPEFAKTLGEKAREWTLSNHSIEHRCRKLIDVINANTARTPAS